MLRFIFISLLLISTICGVSVTSESVRICAQTARAVSHVAEDETFINEETASSFSEEPSVRCASSLNHCFAFWKEDPVNGTVVIMGQGCWGTSGKPQDCEQEQCVSVKKPPRVMNTTKFCCCSGDMCNLNVSDGYIPSEEMPATEVLPTPTLNPLIWVILGGVLAVSVICLSVFIYIYQRGAPNKDDLENGLTQMPSLGNYSLEHIKMCSVVGEGKYGCVWRGLIDDQEVAVKVFPPHHRNYFINERELYAVAKESPALLKCLGGGERFASSPGGLCEYLLILTYEPLGCLQDYLRANAISLATIGRMALGVARGLAHLHSDLGKPCIVHRDLNSRNVLVRADLSCCLCDLGLAVQPRSAESRSLSEAGTLRYMAPEVLEGAVNLRDCESALKQIDVYALGLVIWELGTRCTDMQNGEPQPYSLPFQKESGPHPTLEQMQGLVSRHKARPLWPISWKDSAPARLLCETAEDCWDQDAEARLTALCVEERFLELPSLRGGRVLHSLHPPASPTPLINNNHLHDTLEASVGTIETLLSPSEDHCKNSNQTAACVTPLQPYQGRNPCLERNLLTGSSDSLLIDKSSKHCYNLESQSLMANDYLGLSVPHRGATPIPYLQNAVHGSPKQHNGATVKPKFRWAGLKKFFKKHETDEPHSNLVSEIGLCKDTQVRLVPGKLVNGFGNGSVATSLLSNECNKRPSTLPLMNVKPLESPSCESKAGVSQILRRKNSLGRQRSLEQFTEVFSSTSDLSRLKDPSQRVKTPGDVPPSVRRTRGKAAIDSARFSLYDDRMMGQAQWGSAPDLEPQVAPLKPSQLNDLQDRDSVSSF